eukprot:CAMPEP_0197177752 /NCGR_PEP_ID=MMETSP1423-20130617/3250_1 /TAXON_ID=476441 /ORGANISM="Pseudo-nitzschia heimii, Strain UNC1101" /LENGTH=870 /DNA_ID=CAMNT_0042627357 /DNA_START=226 /DNA_END=2838 /DNA_ORIENTATION=-
MVGSTREIGDTDYDAFPPNLSPVSAGTKERSNEGTSVNENVNYFNDNGSLLGVIVDRSSFDEDDELTTYGRDMPSVIHHNSTSLNLPQHQQLGMELPLGGIVMKNGKVRRKMRWKPRFGKKKSNQYSSNASVVSALTNRSSSTMRSSATTKSFLSHFSRRSGTSFHTFHSTETPVATNKANRPQAPHTVMRPNYQDSFDAKTTPSLGKYATIDSDGKYGNRQRYGGSSQYSVSSSSGFPSTKLDSVKETSLPEQFQEQVEINRSTSLSSGTALTDPKLNAIEAINVRQSSSNSAGSSSIRSSTSKTSLRKPPIPGTIMSTKSSVQQNFKPRRPPLFKRRARHSRNKSSGSLSESSNGSQKLSSPTDTNSTSSLSSAISLERENSSLPVLLGDQEDRRVQIDATRSSSSTKESPSRSRRLIKVDESEDDVILEEAPELHSLSPTIQSNTSEGQTGVQSIQSAPAAVMTRNTTPASLQKRSSSLSKERSTSSTSMSSSSPRRDTGGGSTGGSSVGPPSPVGVPHKKYNRPVSPTKTSQNTKGKFLGGRNKKASVPCDLDEGAFLEAEHNLRAIHDMAAEHLAHGEYEEAADVFEEILRGQQERYGQDHYRVGTALHNLGIVYLKKGDYRNAIEICQRAVDVRKDSLVPNHPDVAVSLSQLGVAHLESKNYHEALAAFRDALNIRRNFLGPRHMKCAKILNNIGCALYSVEDLASAKRAFDEALDIQREGLRSLPSTEGSESNGMQSNNLLLSMASTLCNIGSIRLRWGDFEKAEIALEEALLIQQSVLGDDHPIVSSTIESIELVETAKQCAANPQSAHAFLMKHAAAACTVENPTSVMTEMLGLENFEDISPKNWFANPCGPISYSLKDDE